MKKFTVMRFLSFSNKKETPAKRFEPRAASVRPDPSAREMPQNLQFFFLVNLPTFGRFLSGW
jgi:hypothetical protein